MWFSSSKTRRDARVRSVRRTSALRLETLEERCVPTAGMLDPSFGVGGMVLTDFQAGSLEGAYSIAIAHDNKIVVAGNFTAGGPYGSTDFAVVRYNSDGSLDDSFGSGGKQTIDFALYDTATGVAVQPDGSVVVVGDSGSFTYSQFVVARLTPAGQLDSSFGSGGKQTIVFGSEFEASADVAIQADGRIVVAGYSQDDFAVARLTSAGQLDPTFGTGGKMTIGFGDGDLATGVAVQADGRIVVTGTSIQSQGGSSRYDFAVARLTSAGQLDPSFGSGGKETLEFGYNDVANGVALQPDGSVVVAGYSYQSYQDGSSGVDFAVVRLTVAGTLDPSFGSGGKQIIDFGSGQDYAEGVAVQPNGSIVVAGATGSDFGVARLTSTGMLDSAFGSGGKRIIDFGSDDDYASCVAVQADSNIVVAGRSVSSTTDYDFAVARLLGAAVVNDMVVTGTSRNDIILILPTNHAGEVKAFLNGTLIGTFQPTGHLIVYGLGGNDVISALGCDVPAMLFGGEGNDILIGGSRDNVFVGGNGNDVLTGSGGRDLLIGGAGSDLLAGGSGDDMLIAGPTIFDADVASLAAIMAEWTSNHSYEKRVANLRGTGTGSSFAQRMNGNVFLHATANGTGPATVLNDIWVDILTGGGGRDWFFANCTGGGPLDWLLDDAGNEYRDDLP